MLPTPFLPANVFDLWGLPAEDHRRATTQVLNPLDADRPHLATTLLPGQQYQTPYESAYYSPDGTAMVLTGCSEGLSSADNPFSRRAGI